MSLSLFDIYVTINTLLNDEDFERLIDMVKTLIDAKVDAFIVQDFGVAHILKNTFKNINLHASTQMGIHNLNGAKIAEELGEVPTVVATGGLSKDIIIHCKNDIIYNANLLLDGLREIYEKNR